MEALFSYGTLQQSQVQLDTFGRLLEGESDTLLGYRIAEVKITDAAVIASSGKDIHPILIRTGSANDKVEGTVFLITDDELAHADNYEVDEYLRVSARLASGKQCWIYAAAE
ncbi:gamma-glutamylcyclotransferase family protein [Pseudoalteromonas byunsanensis]|uniref:UDP-N-acetylmuramate--alanine ligase n=1 Tax=Pseudoalteromonas byunsanensis TaxID=327939 RepID=A0A1S1N8I5_9GAMM|nr:gamma-glutamylcyclotransferase family protein [Pseudoalteromonas byunsanensis]OHU94574.1 UDP-N-acetylmuramate--alanine ligase [Pseudoalteromonas byunsanensis]